MLSESQRVALRFFRARAQDATPFSAADVERVCGWGPGSFTTYKTKHLKEYLTAKGSGKFTIKPEFLRIGDEEFENIVSQSRKTVARFVRSVFDAVLRYEFLLPLTNERKLRGALDELFYRDHLIQRAKEIGVATLERIIPRADDENVSIYIERVVAAVGSLLGGYSIGHVNGRFRAGPLKGHAEAAEVVAARGRYLVDETTAVVRFVLPLVASRSEHGVQFDVTKAASTDSSKFDEDIDVARRLFISFFVESVILDIHGEDEIWFLESGPSGERLYVLERNRTTDNPSKTVDSKSEEEQLEFPAIGNPLDTWLRASGYEKVANDIAEIVEGWKQNKLKTKRNWWDVLAGDRNGKPRDVGGVTFPVIAAIRKRQGLSLVAGALSSAADKPLPRKAAVSGGKKSRTK